MSPGNGNLTYGEFVKRRAALLAKINRLKDEYKRATDPRYTALVDNPGQYALAELSATEVQLGNLIAQWEQSNTKRGVTP